MAARERTFLLVSHAPPLVVPGPERLKEERGERSNIFRLVSRNNCLQRSAGLTVVAAELALFCVGFTVLCKENASFSKENASFSKENAEFSAEFTELSAEFTSSILI